MEILSNSFLPGDQRFVDQIVRELKSQGIFDQFRKECISDVDTKPAYQNLRQRVENSVSGFLNKQKWNPEMNRNQVREMLRKNIHELGFLETGVERIVDQVVNPKITTVFLPKVEDVVYKFLGIEKPAKIKVECEDDGSKTPEKKGVHESLSNDLGGTPPQSPERKRQQEESGSKDETDICEKDVEKSFIADETKMMQEENNSVDSQSSNMSGISNQDSNQSQKQESAVSSIVSEIRISSSENSKMETSDVFVSQKSSDSNSKFDEDDDVAEGNAEKRSKESSSSNKKTEKNRSSSDKSKYKSDKDKAKSDKHRRDDRTDKEKYKIPKLSDRNKSSEKEKDSRTSVKDSNSKESAKNKDRKSEKDRDRKSSSKHSSSERDGSRSESRSRKDKYDKKERDRRDKRGGDKKDEKGNSSSSTKEKCSSNAGSSSKSKEKDAKKKAFSVHENNNTKRDCGKNEREERKPKRDDKKRSLKDDHYSSRDKNNGRRSSDRDSDGPPDVKKTSSSHQRDPDKLTSKCADSNSSSNFESSAGDSGNSDKIENASDEKINTIKLPKFASNFEEAKKIMKIRKQLKKLESSNNPDENELKRILKEISELSNKDAKDNEKKEVEREQNEKIPLDINDFISSPNISMAQWDALEAKFMQQMGKIDYDSYESPNANISDALTGIDASRDKNLEIKPIVLLKKSSLTEEMIRMTTRNNGDQSGMNVEIEKENIEINEMVELYMKNNISTSDAKDFDKGAIASLLNDGEMCVGLESFEGNGKIAAILECFIEILRIDIGKSVEILQRMNLKRKCDISNNNFENDVSKKAKIEDSDREIAIDAEQEVKTSSSVKSVFLPPAVSSDDSETALEKKSETKKAKRQSTPRNISQRYSSEDLYKPRICLRRNKKGSPNP